MIETIYVLEAIFLLGSILLTAIVFFRKPKVTIPIEFEKVEKEILKALSNISCAEHDIFSVRLALEGEAVEVGRNVAGGPRVAVVVPGAADAVRLLIDREVAEAGPVELHAMHRPPAPALRADVMDAPWASPSRRTRSSAMGPTISAW